MDESNSMNMSSDHQDLEQSLQSLFDIVGRLEAEPTNIPLLREHLDVARRCQMEEQVQKGLEMLCEVTAVGQALWLETLTNILNSLPTVSDERLPSILSLLAKAASDYCCIPVLTLTARILTAISGVPPRPDEDAMDTTADRNTCVAAVRIEEEQARMIWRQAVTTADFDLSQSHEVWSMYKEWEERILLSLPRPSSEREAQLKRLHEIWIDRLATPHAGSSETSQAYSSFNSTYCPESYEANMVTATKAAQKPSAKYELREEWERGYLALVESAATSEAITLTSPIIQQKLAYLYAYLEMEMAGGEKKSDWKMVQCVYERLVAVLGDVGGRDAKIIEATLWEKYGNYMGAANGPSRHQKAEVWARSVRACPGSGDLWAKLLRLQESTEQPAETIGETYLRALSLGELTRKVNNPVPVKPKAKGKGKPGDQDDLNVEDGVPNELPSGVIELVKLEVAWAGFMRRQEEGDDDMGDDDDTESAVEATLRAGIAQVHTVDSRGDPDYKLEKYLISWLRRKGKTEEAAEVWETIAKSHGRSYRMWLAYTDFEVSRLNYSKARTLFKNAVSKNLDWPEVVWEAWISFEEFYGNVETLETAKTRVGHLQESRAKRQAKVMQEQQALPAQTVVDGIKAVVSAEVAPVLLGKPVATEVDLRKRKAEDADVAVVQHSGEAKRGRYDNNEADDKEALDLSEEAEGPKQHLQRDREHSTVFVAGLAPGTTNEAVIQRFRDCGEIREVVVTEKGDRAVATVEFVDRESCPAALTKDKKKIGDAQIDVYLASRSTLFITNFPEKADDESMRKLFEPYGEILDTRWPSKKFKDSRRFLYLQYLTPDSAKKALELHGTELQPGMPLSVLISDPEHKKERTDAHANEKEVYVTQLSRFAAEKDLEKLFSQCGSIKRINLPLDPQGHCRGFGFVEFEDEASATAALALDGKELKKRKIAVQKAQARAKGSTKRHAEASGSGQSGRIDFLSRSVRLKHLPEKTQEGLLQQALEKITNVKVLQVFEDLHEATAELNSAADVGALLLRAEPFVFHGATLGIEAETDPSRADIGERVIRPAASRAHTEGAPKSSTSFVPRPPKTAAKKRLALAPQTAKKLGSGATITSGDKGPAEGSSTGGQEKGQDDFRRMLLEGKK